MNSSVSCNYGKSIWVTLFFYQIEFIKAKAILQMIQAGKLFIMAIYEEIPIKY